MRYKCKVSSKCIFLLKIKRSKKNHQNVVADNILVFKFGVRINLIYFDIRINKTTLIIILYHYMFTYYIYL